MIKVIFFSLFFSELVFANLTIEDLDFYRKSSNPQSISIVSSGTNYCKNYFSSDKSINISLEKTFKNSFSCKYSLKRNRFYVFMVAQTRNQEKTIRENCLDVLNNWPEIMDHMDETFFDQRKLYLKGFYVENIFNNQILSFSNIYAQDELEKKNLINQLILDKKSSFSFNDEENNKLIKREILRLEKIYKKIMENKIPDLHKIIKLELDKITRYKIFINDLNGFKSYSCNWKPGKGLNPYVKKEKFNEFENI